MATGKEKMWQHKKALTFICMFWSSWKLLCALLCMLPRSFSIFACCSLIIASARFVVCFSTWSSWRTEATWCESFGENIWKYSLSMKRNLSRIMKIMKLKRAEKSKPEWAVWLCPWRWRPPPAELTATSLAPVQLGQAVLQTADDTHVSCTLSITPYSNMRLNNIWLCARPPWHWDSSVGGRSPNWKPQLLTGSGWTDQRSAPSALPLWETQESGCHPFKFSIHLFGLLKKKDEIM